MSTLTIADVLDAYYASSTAPLQRVEISPAARDVLVYLTDGRRAAPPIPSRPIPGTVPQDHLVGVPVDVLTPLAGVQVRGIDALGNRKQWWPREAE